MTYLDLKHWRDAAVAYKDKEQKKSLPREDRMRISKLVLGHEGALREDVSQIEQMRHFLKEVKKGG